MGDNAKGTDGTAGSAAEGNWHFCHAGIEYGPLNDEQLCRAADSGLLLPSDEVWQANMEGRFVAADVQGLFADTQRTGSSEEAPRPEKTPASGSDSRGMAAAPAMLFLPTVSGTGSMTCPYCWHRFDPEDLLFIARHADLGSDPVLGDGEALRYLPSHFNAEGHAIDAGGMVCPDVSCPRCHMRLPRSLGSFPPLFISIVGAPASGKSYLLASMCTKLRTTLPRQFLVRFTDSDAQTNRWLIGYEERLFMQADESVLQSIDKTELRGNHYQEALFGGMSVSLPLPCMFSVQARADSLFHRRAANAIDRSVVMYDNAGEHFEPGRDTAMDPGTQHLAHAEGVLFLFDPTKDPRFRKVLSRNGDLQLRWRHTVQRQDVLLTETISRIRLYLGLDARERYEKPLVVIVSKADVLGDMLEDFLDQPPWKWDETIEACALDLSRIRQVSFALRSVMDDLAPDIVATAESFAEDVIYMPVTALGHSPCVADPAAADDEIAPLAVRPCDVRPKWAEVPMLYLLARLGYLAVSTSADESHPLPERFAVRGGLYHFLVPGTTHLVKVPLSFAGQSLRCPKTGRWFRVPTGADQETGAARETSPT